MRIVILAGALGIIGLCFAIKGEDPTTVLPIKQEFVRTTPFLEPQPEVIKLPDPIEVPVLIIPKQELKAEPEYVVVQEEDPEPAVDWDEVMMDGIMYFEGFYKRKYYCSGGKATIGYGCTKPEILAKGYVDKQFAEEVLRDELENVREQVLQAVSVDLSDYQLCALTSFTFNCGVANLKRLVDRPGRLNDGNFDSIEKYLPRYRKAGGEVRKGLEKRRRWEVSMWKGEPLADIN